MTAIMELYRPDGSVDVDVGGCRFAVGEQGWRSVIFCGEVFVGECGVCGELWGIVG
jgi:hypothetical protein